MSQRAKGDPSTKDTRPACDASPHPFTADQRLRKVERLLRPHEFTRTQRRGRRYVTPALVIILVRGEQPWTRVGITVSRKVGNAVVRNSVKRRLREIFRCNKAALPQGWDVVWIARSAAAQTSFEELREQALTGTNRATQRRRGRRNHRRGDNPRDQTDRT
ncbi:MAG: ribonuclease P protein component [Myxococcales bacterium]|nr:ribonuclease P protein component [Myxococcales bacterium]